MARPLRIEFAGALYHVTSRGDRRESIYEDDEDREKFIAVLSEVVHRFNWMCHAYCLMTNHYHIVVETPEGNLSQGMRQLNGMYTQATNRRHGRIGHLFQGRFKGILVDKDSYLLELARYVVLNPVRAGIVKDPLEYPWSSYRSTVGEKPVPIWLETDVLLGYFGQRRAEARRKYRQFVTQGIQADTIWSELRQQIYLGDENFVSRMHEMAKIKGDELTIPRVQRRGPVQTLKKIFDQHAERDDGIIAAYETGAYSYREIAEYLELHLATVGRIVRTRML